MSGKQSPTDTNGITIKTENKKQEIVNLLH